MALTAGMRFGPYEVAERIGAGGMGEVYRATDTTLERDVAIKVLPESFAADADWVARFEREAKTLATLNHPNIAQIYGLERGAGTTALVMELVDGATLADRIAEGPLPADEALGIAMQIAEALEAAHGQGIVHRDLKPANVKLRPDGAVKVLDFGIAKTLDLRAASGQPAAAMTTPAMTQTGVILGTAAYMSPEQARGKPIDDRTDIWAFGCVLYEMLTGQPAFAGEDVAITLARILANDTDLKSLPGAVSPAVVQTIELCLQKDVKKRIADIRDVRLALAGAFDTVTVHGAALLGGRKPLWRRSLPIVAPPIAAVIAGLSVWIVTYPDPAPTNRFAYELPQNQVLASSNFTLLAVAPDGRNFVYGTQNGLYLRSMNDLEAHLIVGTEQYEAVLPRFSADGRALAFISPGRVSRISANGGAAVLITGLSSPPTGLTWANNDMLYFGMSPGIFAVAASGGMPALVAPVEDTAGFLLSSPRLLPDGDSLMFTAFTGGNAGAGEPGQIVVRSLTTGEQSVVVEGGADARYLTTGHLVYALENNLFAVAFDLSSLTVSGSAIPVVQDVMRDTQAGTANYDVSENGTLVYFRGEANTLLHTLVWVDRDGSELPLSAPPRSYFHPRISPDGSRVALDVRDQELDVWIWDLTGGRLTRLTFDPAEDEFPTWSPDGQRIYFSSTRESGISFTTSLYSKSADGTGTDEKLAQSAGQQFPTAVVADNEQMLVWGAAESDVNDNIAIVTLEDGQTRPLLNTTFTEMNPVLSPDGRWMAYSSNESGRDEVYVRPFPEVESGRWQVSTGGGIQPVWARDGTELFYRIGQAVMAAPVQTEPSFTVGNPKLLFEGDYVVGPGGRNYDVAPDGERFLMVKAYRDASAPPEIIIIENWFTELQRLVPAE